MPTDTRSARANAGPKEQAAPLASAATLISGPPTRAELAVITDALPANAKAALQSWRDYEEMLTCPFVPKEDCARLQPTFAVIRLGERESENLNDPSLTSEQWVLLVRFEQEVELKTRSGELRAFRSGDKALVAISKGSIQNQTAATIAHILREFGELPLMTLKQLPSKQKGHNGAIVLTSIETIV